MTVQKSIIGGIAAAGAGALIPLSFAPFNQIIPSFIGLSLFAGLILQAQSQKQIFTLALLFGFGLFAVGVSWVYVSIHQYGEAATPLALMMTFAFVLFLAAIFATPWLLLGLFQRNPYSLIAGFASVWFLGEWLRGWFLTGFPWLYLGQAHLHSNLSGWLPIIGSQGVGFIQALICATFATTLLYRRQNPRLYALTGLAILVYLASILLDAKEWTAPEQVQQVTLIQPNIPLQDKWNPALRDANLQRLLDLSRDAWNTDILVWPEAALPLTTLGNDDLLNQLTGYLGPETSLLTGRLVYNPANRRFYNNLIGLGAARGEYSKRRLVPFGEYVPLEDQLRGLIEFFDLPMSVISAGEPQQESLTAGDAKLAIALCYEIAYGNQVAADSRDANLLITISNDTWFGDSIGPHQHFQLAQIRARETGKPVLRGTNNGISGVIDHRGNAVAQTGQFIATSLQAEVIPHSGSTPFSLRGQKPMLALVTAILLALGLQGRLQHQKTPTGDRE